MNLQTASFHRSAVPFGQRLLGERPADLVVVGTGNVGGALLDQIAARTLQGGAGPALRVVAIANSRRMTHALDGVALHAWRDLLPRSDDTTDLEKLLRRVDTAGRHLTVVDATASEGVAGRHAGWLRRGAHVVSANKLGCGGDLTDLREIRLAALQGSSRYAVSTTVGAGLPVLRTLADLISGGDRVLSIRATCSGSLAYLFSRIDAGARFGDALREAIASGYTEPDPRIDLSGADVARKLLILARSSGHEIEHHAARVESLVPDALARCGRDEFLERIDELEATLAPRWKAARARGATFRYVGRFTPEQGVDVGLIELPTSHPFAQTGGTDNVFEIATQHYRERPIVIQGPGAGPQITAAGLLRDILAVTHQG